MKIFECKIFLKVVWKEVLILKQKLKYWPTVYTFLNSVKSTKTTLEKNPTVEKNCLTELYPGSLLPATLSVRQQKLATVPTDLTENSKLNSSFIKMSSDKDRIYFNSSNEKARFTQSSKAPEKSQHNSYRNLPLTHEISKESLQGYNIYQSLYGALSLFTTSSDSSHRTRNWASLNTNSSSSVHEFENCTSQLEENSDVYSKAVPLLSVSNKNLAQNIKTSAEQCSIKCYYPPELSKFKSSFCDNSESEFEDLNQTQESYLSEPFFTTSPVSANSSGYCSTSQSSSFLEFENVTDSSSHSTSSSFSLSNSSDCETVTQERMVQNQSDCNNQYFGSNECHEKVSSSTKKINKVDTSKRIESILSENNENRPANGKSKNFNLVKKGAEYINKRNTNKPNKSFSSAYKPETHVILNQNSLDKSVMYIYDENNRDTDSAKWETFFSSRPKSQLQNCSSQRYKATNLQNKQSQHPVQTEDIKTEYSVDYLLSFREETFIDTHCHLDYLMDKLEYKDTFTDYRREYPYQFPPSYGGCVTVFCNPLSFKRTLQWKKLLSEEYIWAAFGCHPKSADHYTDSIEDDLCSALSHPKVRALGEIGLDYSERSTCSKVKQKEVFKRQIMLGLAFDLPLVIHCRDAYDDCLEILKEFVPRNHPIHLHCFTSEWGVAQKYLKSFPTLCIGVTNVVTFKSSLNVQEVVKNIPLDRLLLETDAPYFVPNSLSKKFKVSHPGMAIFVAAKVASIRNIPLKNVLMQTRKNTKKVYKI